MAEEEDLMGDDEKRMPKTFYNNFEESDKKECCGCKKTKCLKLYCECF